MQDIEATRVPVAENPGEASRATLSITLDADLAARLAAFVCRNPDFAGPEEAARRILRRWLAENGFDGAREDEGIRPEALNASNDD